VTPRADTESDPSPLSMVREDVVELRRDLKALTSQVEKNSKALEDEKAWGQDHGKRIRDIEEWQRLHENEAAKEEGRDEAAREAARKAGNWGKGGSAAAGVLAIIEIIRQLLQGG
jgi:hypothetical protein